MGTTAMGIGKALLMVVVAALVVVSVPAGSALALGAFDSTPPPTTATVSTLRLELAWARLQASHAQMVVLFDFASKHAAEVQQLIDRARASGKDVTNLQTALDNLEAALRQAQLTLDGMSGIIAAHAGFDANGDVADIPTAVQTVRGLADADKEIQTILKPAQQAFQQVAQAFRQTNGATPTTASAANLRLELAWARLQAGHARAEVIFDFADQRMEEVQQLVDRARASGKDVSSLQTALDSLEAAFKQAQPIFAGATGTITSHPGFDSNGNATDVRTALQTIKDLAAENQDIEAILRPAQQAFQQALQTFRQTIAPTATPGS